MFIAFCVLMVALFVANWILVDYKSKMDLYGIETTRMMLDIIESK